MIPNRLPRFKFNYLQATAHVAVSNWFSKNYRKILMLKLINFYFQLAIPFDHMLGTNHYSFTESF